MNTQILSGLVISLIALACIIISLIYLQKGLIRTTVDGEKRKKIMQAVVRIVLVWVILLGILSGAGVFAKPGLPPPPVFTVLIGVIVLVSLSYTSVFRAVLINSPLHWLVLFQAFRIAVEIWFFESYQSGVFPQIMTFEGENWDIVAGVLALPAGWLIYRFPRFNHIIAVIYNIAGFLILGHTLYAAAASMPSPVQVFPFDERLVLLGTFPFIYLPGVLVTLALGFHLLSLRQVYLKPDRRKVPKVSPHYKAAL